jgi:flagellar motility protein MotE (MotC chaperone)
VSEYQYYEFMAVDRPLTEGEMGELRGISTRADITTTSFTNEYSWGDLKADSVKLLQRYFDVFVYVSNWGTHQLGLRIPSDAFDRKTLERYLIGDQSSSRAGSGYVVIDLRSDVEYSEDWEEGRGWMASLAPVRSDLLRGDLRPLYIAWLACIQDGDINDDASEPPVPAGLRQLTSAQLRLAEFLRVNEHLLEVAANVSEDEVHASDGLASWIASLPVKEKDRLLVTVAHEQEIQVGAALVRRYRRHLAKTRPGVETTFRRGVGGLLEAAATRREEHENELARRAEKERKRREVVEAKARTKHLDALAKRENAAWKEVEQLVSSKRPKAYDDAVVLLRDLRDLAERAKKPERFTSKIAALTGRHSGKRSFVARLHKAGLTA